MSDPRRWLDDPANATGFERDLLRHGVEADPPEGAQAAVWKALAAQLLVGGAAAVGTTAASGTAAAGTGAAAATTGATASAATGAAGTATATGASAVAGAGASAGAAAATATGAVAGAAAASGATLGATAAGGAVVAGAAAGSSVTAGAIGGGLLGAGALKALAVAIVVGGGTATYVAVSPTPPAQTASELVDTAAEPAPIAATPARASGAVDSQPPAEPASVDPAPTEAASAEPAPLDPAATAAPTQQPASKPAPASGSAALSRPTGSPASAKPDLDGEARAAAARAASDERAARLRAERQQIGSAKDMLKRGDAAGALRVLDQVARDYPDGMSAQERESLAITALARAGNRAAARARAEAFLRAWPNSLFAAQVKDYTK
jgi:hypothetical protein